MQNNWGKMGTERVEKKKVKHDTASTLDCDEYDELSRKLRQQL